MKFKRGNREMGCKSHFKNDLITYALQKWPSGGALDLQE